MPERNAEATRSRILAAATTEFAEHGLAGARVDRIADAAEANKSLIYSYFGNKGALFDAVIETAFQHAHDTVPFTPNDLVGYAVSLFDYLHEHPAHLRLDTWRRLERPDPTELEHTAFTEKVDALTNERPAYGKGDRFSPADVIALVISLSSTWVSAPAAIRALASQDLDHQRELIAGAMTVLVASQQHT